MLSIEVQKYETVVSPHRALLKAAKAGEHNIVAAVLGKSGGHFEWFQFVEDTILCIEKCFKMEEVGWIRLL